MPAGQSWQVLAVVAPLAVEYCPTRQAVHKALAVRPSPVKYVPAEQSMQERLLWAPVPVQYVPAAQAVHAELSALTEKVPAGHVWHTALVVRLQAVTLYCPDAQVVQGEHALASAVGENVASSVQSVQTALAVDVHTDALNLPATHVVHGLQADEPEVTLKVPAAHPWQAADVSIPTPVLKVPAKHAVHDWAPVDVQPPWVPAPHGFGHARMIMGEYVSPLKL